MNAPPSPARITVVESTGCHFCEDARSTLGDLAARGDIELRLVDACSEEGKALIGRHRPPMFPLVLLDDEPFSHGRLPRRKLAKRLAGRHGTVTVG